MGQYHGIHLCRLKHIDVLALLLLVRHIIDGLFFLCRFLILCRFTVRAAAVVYDFSLHFVAFLVRCSLCLAAFFRTLFLFVRVRLIHLKAFRQRHIIAL